MKKISVLCVMCLFPWMVMAAGERPAHDHGGDHGKHATMSSTHDQQRFIGEPDATVYVNGMVCSFCAQGITKKMHQHPAIKASDVDLDHQQVRLQFHHQKTVSDKDLKTLIEEAGFNVERIKR